MELVDLKMFMDLFLVFRMGELLEVVLWLVMSIGYLVFVFFVFFKLIFMILYFEDLYNDGS